MPRRIAPRSGLYSGSRQANARDEVRLRLVLAGDGTIRNMFPIKSAAHALTESAVIAAQQIKFGPAVKRGLLVSQFVTLVYEFKKKDAKPKNTSYRFLIRLGSWRRSPPTKPRPRQLLIFPDRLSQLEYT